MSELLDISAMEPGPEIDTAVGKRIGATPKIAWYAMNKEETAYCMDFERESAAEDWLNDIVTRFPDSRYAQDGYHIVRSEIYPRYSEDISAAWQLIEMLKPNYWVQVISSRNGAECEIGEYGNKDTVFRRRAKDVPEAICRAVLLLDIQKASAPTEAVKEISHLNCTIDVSKSESLIGPCESCS